MERKMQKFKQEDNQIIFRSNIQLKTLDEILRVMNFADGKKEWRLPSMDEIKVLLNKCPKEILDNANIGNLPPESQEGKYFFTDHYTEGNFSIPSLATVYDAISGQFGQYKWIGYCRPYLNALIIGTEKGGSE